MMASSAIDVRSIKHQAFANALFGVCLVTRSGDVTDSDLYPAAENVTAPDRATARMPALPTKADGATGKLLVVPCRAVPARVR